MLLALSPVHLHGSVGSLRIDEETPFDWKAVALRARARLLLGALKIAVEAQGGVTQGTWSVLGISRPFRPNGRPHSGRPPKPERPLAHGEQDGHDSERTPVRGRRHGAGGARDMSSYRERKGKPTGPAGDPKRRRGGEGGKVRAGRSRGIPLDAEALRRLWPEARWLLGEAKRRLSLSAKGSLVYGFPDPFATGMTHGWLASARLFPGLRLEPDYGQGRLEGWIEVGLKAYPWQFLLVFARLLFRPAVRAMWWPRLKNRFRFTPHQTKEVART